MIRKILLGVLGIFSLAFGAVAHAGPILWESGINVDGDLTPGGVDISLFDLITGLGSIEVTVSGAGDHVVIGFFDYEIDETTDTFYNETGSAVGTAAARQTWEIDEPGFGGPLDYPWRARCYSLFRHGFDLYPSNRSTDLCREFNERQNRQYCRH